MAIDSKYPVGIRFNNWISQPSNVYSKHHFILGFGYKLNSDLNKMYEKIIKNPSHGNDNIIHINWDLNVDYFSFEYFKN